MGGGGHQLLQRWKFGRACLTALPGRSHSDATYMGTINISSNLFMLKKQQSTQMRALVDPCNLSDPHLLIHEVALLGTLVLRGAVRQTIPENYFL